MGISRAYEKRLAGLSLPSQNVFRYLSDDGTSSGTKNAIGNYSDGGLGETFFYYESPFGKTTVAQRMIMKIRDAAPFSADGYGGISALTNGITFLIRNDADEDQLDLTDGIPIQNNADWGRLCFDMRLDSFGSGDDFVTVRWTFSNSGSALIIPPGWKIGALFHDDLSGLDAHYFFLNGYSEVRGFISQQ